MEEKVKLAFYTLRYNPDLGIPIAIIACTFNPSFNKYFAESYIFFPKNDEFFGFKITSEPQEILDLKIDLNFMYEEALKAAQDKTYNYLYELNKGNKNTHYLHFDIHLKESNPIDFIQLIKSKKYDKEIAAIRNKTKCKKLQNLIDEVVDADTKFYLNRNVFTID